MAGRTYRARGIVLRKTKLRESDSIVTFIDSQGEKIQAVAHGARRPGNSLSGRMELYTEVDIVCAKGRSLDVVSDSRIVSDASRRFGMEQSIAAAAVAELLSVIAQPGLQQARLYDLARSSFDAIAASDASYAPVLAAAALMKICAVSGLRPMLTQCARCGSAMKPDESFVPFSYGEGGLLCEDCRGRADALMVSSSAVEWCNALIYSRYSEILAYEDAPTIAADVLSFAKDWIQAHLGCRMKSLDIMFVFMDQNAALEERA